MGHEVMSRRDLALISLRLRDGRFPRSPFTGAAEAGPVLGMRVPDGGRQRGVRRAARPL